MKNLNYFTSFVRVLSGWFLAILNHRQILLIVEIILHPTFNIQNVREVHRSQIINVKVKFSPDQNDGHCTAHFSNSLWNMKELLETTEKVSEMKPIPVKALLLLWRSLQEIITRKLQQKNWGCEVCCIYIGKKASKHRKTIMDTNMQRLVLLEKFPDEDLG